MIFTDREIQIALSRKQIIIDPQPEAIAYSSTSVDLTLDSILNIFRVGTPAVKKVIDPTIPDHNVDEILAEITTVETIDPSKGYELPVRHLVLGWTAEYIELPIDSRIAARVEGKSSLARLGLGVHIYRPYNSRWVSRPNSSGDHQSWPSPHPIKTRNAYLPVDLRANVGNGTGRL